MTTLYLTRHGQTMWNLEKRLQGTQNSPLTKAGIMQAEDLRDRLKDIDVDIIYTSPLERAYKTAEIIKGNKEIPLLVHNGLMEINFGAWEGMTLEEIEGVEEYKYEYSKFFNTPSKYTPFKGESVSDFVHRIQHSIIDIINENRGKNILIVTHGMTLKFLMTLFKSLDIDDIVSLPVMGQAALTHIEVQDNEYKILLEDDRSHYRKEFITKGW